MNDKLKKMVDALSSNDIPEADKFKLNRSMDQSMAGEFNKSSSKLVYYCIVQFRYNPETGSEISNLSVPDLPEEAQKRYLERCIGLIKQYIEKQL